MTGVAIMFLFVFAHFVGETPYAIFETMMGDTSPAWFTMIWIVLMAFHDVRHYVKYMKEDK